MATDDTRVSDLTPDYSGASGNDMGRRYGGAGEGAGGVDDAQEEMNSDNDAVDTSRGMSSGQSSGTDYSYGSGGQKGTTDDSTVGYTEGGMGSSDTGGSMNNVEGYGAAGMGGSSNNGDTSLTSDSAAISARGGSYSSGGTDVGSTDDYSLSSGAGEGGYNTDTGTEGNR